MAQLAKYFQQGGNQWNPSYDDPVQPDYSTGYANATYP